MSIGGKSLHKKDWLQLGLLAGTAASGLGAAGIGPLAGLLGGSTGIAGATAGGIAAADAAGAGLGSAAEMAAINSAMGLAPAAGIAGSTTAGKGVLDSLQALQRANQFAQLAQGGMGGPPQAAGARPQPQVPVSGDGMDYLRRIYGGMK